METAREKELQMKKECMMEAATEMKTPMEANPKSAMEAANEMKSATERSATIRSSMDEADEICDEI